MSQDNKPLEQTNPLSNFKFDTDNISTIEKPDDTLETVGLPTTNLKDINILLNATDSNVTKNETGREWFNALNRGLETAVFDGGLDQTTSNPNALFSQVIDSSIGDLKPGTPSFKTEPGRKYTGDGAKIRLRAQLGMGTAFTVPLWHSGMWVTLKTPSEAALLELYREINADKVSLGRSNYGLIFSNSTSYTSKALFDFILTHLISTTLSVPKDDDVRNYIKIQDLPVLVWGAACATWPKGFNYSRACACADKVKDLKDEDKLDVCTHVTTGKIDLRKLSWTDTTKLTPKQVNHMSNRSTDQMSVESIKSYISDFTNGIDKKVKLNENAYIILTNPSVVEHIEAGNRWVSEIEQRYTQAMIKDSDERDKYLYSQAKASVMCQYSHYVKALIVNDEEYTDKDLIDDMLSEMSSEDKFRDTFLKEVSSFIDESVISLIAIPTYKCPNCGHEQSPNKASGLSKSLIPLDVAATFFILLVQKIMKIEER